MLAAGYGHLKPGVHQSADLWLLLPTLVLTALHADLHQTLAFPLSKYCLSAASADLCDHTLLCGLEACGANLSWCCQPSAPRSKNSTQKEPSSSISQRSMMICIKLLLFRCQHIAFPPASGDLCDHSLRCGLAAGGANFSSCCQPSAQDPKITPKKNPAPADHSVPC